MGIELFDENAPRDVVENMETVVDDVKKEKLKALDLEQYYNNRHNTGIINRFFQNSTTKAVLGLGALGLAGVGGYAMAGGELPDMSGVGGGIGDAFNAVGGKIGEWYTENPVATVLGGAGAAALVAKGTHVGLRGFHSTRHERERINKRIEEKRDAILHNRIVVREDVSSKEADTEPPAQAA